MDNVGSQCQDQHDILVEAVPEDQLESTPPKVAQHNDDEYHLKTQDKLVIMLKINTCALHLRIVLKELHLIGFEGVHIERTTGCYLLFESLGKHGYMLRFLDYSKK